MLADQISRVPTGARVTSALLSLSKAIARPLAVVVFAAAVALPAAAQQIADPNVNMVRGVSLENGDPYLQRQNEGSLAISTRNPCHLLAAANDYRTVDIADPNQPPGIEPSLAGDAWIGIYKSFDCGAKWTNFLLDGYPQQAGATDSPLHGFEAAADPIVRAMHNGVFVVGGMAFNRVKDTVSEIFSAWFIDNNNKERGDTFQKLHVTVLDKGSDGQFLDKPWLAVDVPRAGSNGSCEIVTPLESGTTFTQRFRAGNAYMAWARFTGDGRPNPAKLMFARTSDCGKTWQVKPISDNQLTSQGATIAIAPNDGTIYVAWRQFGKNGKPHAIYMSSSNDGGKTFSRPRVVISSFIPFDQPKSPGEFRTNSLPTIAADDLGNVYVAVAARGYASASDDARIVLAVSTNRGKTFAQPYAIDPPASRGHQVMPALTFAAGRLQLVYYDFRYDKSGVFEWWVNDKNIPRTPKTPAFRHTVEVMSATAEPGVKPAFQAQQISQYRRAVFRDNGGAPRYTTQLNPPNLPMFACGDDPANCRPFIGDYLDVAALPSTPARSGQEWIPNAGSNPPRSTGFPPLPVFHAAWTDNRDVKPPFDGKSWHLYQKPLSGHYQVNPINGVAQQCTAGMRNQNIYTARLTPGLYVGSPQNTKPLGSRLNPKTKQPELLERSFVVFLQNTRKLGKSYYRLTIVKPRNVEASWRRFAAGDPDTEIDVRVPAMATLARTVYVRSAQVDAGFRVDVQELNPPSGTPPVLTLKDGGLRTSVFFNADGTVPPIEQPDFVTDDVPQIAHEESHDPAIFDPLVTAVFRPGMRAIDIKNPGEENPGEENPGEENPGEENPGEENPGEENPGEENPAIMPGEENPGEENPGEENPGEENTAVENTALSDGEVANATIQDIQWKVKNTGNTTTAYVFSPVVSNIAPDLRFQLIVSKRYYVPRLNPDTCAVGVTRVNEVVSNISNFRPRTPGEENPGEENPGEENPGEENPGEENTSASAAMMSALADSPTTEEKVGTFMLAPGETATITLRVYDLSPEPVPDGTDPTMPPADILPIETEQQVAAEVVSQPADTGETAPASAASGADLITSDPMPVANPGSIMPGSTFTLTWWLTNRGTQPAISSDSTNGTIKQRVYLSTDNVLSAEDVLLTATDGQSVFTAPSPLPACATPTDTSCKMQFVRDFTVPSGLPYGPYYAIVIADDDNDAGETDPVDPENEVFEADDFNNFAVAALGAPTAVPDSYPTDEDQTLTVATPGVLANDSNLLTGATVSVVTGPEHGTLTLNADGSFTYTPAPNFNGSDTFTYQGVYGTARGNVATVTIEVAPVDDPPVAAPDWAWTSRDTSVDVQVLANDSDPEGDPISLLSFTSPAHGAAVIQGGIITYTPAPDYSGPDSFTYTVGANTLTATAVVSVTVAPVNYPTVANDDQAVTFENQPVAINVLGNDSDPDGVVLLGQPFLSGLGINLPFTGEVAVNPATGLVYFSSSAPRLGVVDPGVKRVVATITNPGRPGSSSNVVADTATGVLYFRQGINGILAVDGRPSSATFNMVIATPSLEPKRTQSLALDERRHLLYVATNTPQSSGPQLADITIIDVNPSSPTFHQVVGTVPLPAGSNPRGMGVHAGTNRIYVSMSGGGNGGVWMIDGVTHALTRIANTFATGILAVNEPSNLIYAAGTGPWSGITNYVQAVDGRTATLLATVQIPGTVTLASFADRMAIHEGTGHVYLKTGDAAPNGKIVVIDGSRTSPTFNSVIGTIPVAADLGGMDMAIDARIDRLVAVAGGPLSAAISVVNTATNTVVSTFDSNTGASEMAINLVTHIAYVSGGIGELRAINLVTGVNESIATGVETGGFGLNPATGAAYGVHTGPGGTFIDRFNTNGTSASVAGLPHHRGRYLQFAVDRTRNRIYAANSGSNIDGTANANPGFLTIIDGRDDHIIKNVAAGSSPFGVAVNESSNKVYISNLAGGTPFSGGVTVMDGSGAFPTTAANVTAFGQSAGFGRDIFVNERTGKVYARVTSSDDPTLSAGVLDPATNVVTPLPASLGTVRIIRVDSSRNRIYLGVTTGTAPDDTHRIVVLDGGTDAVVGSVAVGYPSTFIITGQYIGMDLSRNRLYVADFRNDVVSVVDAGTLTGIATIPVGDGPTAVVVNEVTNRIFVSNASDKTLSIIDGVTLAEVSRQQMPLRAISLTIDPARNRLFAHGGTHDDGGIMVLSDDPAARGSAEIVTAGSPTNGTTSVNPDNRVTYTPGPNFFGTDTFSYTLSDGRGGIATATVNVTVVHPNEAPTARDDLYSVDQNTTLTAPDNGVLDNDLDDSVSVSSLRATLVKAPDFGTLALDPSGRFTYTPTTNFHGDDSFVYEVSDPQGGWSRATARLIVLAPATPTQQAVTGWERWSPLGPISTGYGSLDALATDPSLGFELLNVQERSATGIEINRWLASGTYLTSFIWPLVGSPYSGFAMAPTSWEMVTGRMVPGANGEIVQVQYYNGGTIATLATLPWMIDPLGNGSGQQQFAIDTTSPQQVYFWDNTQAGLYRVDRTAGTVELLMALDTGTPAGVHVSTKTNDVAFDERTQTVLVSDGSTNSILQYNPGGSPITFASGLPLAPSALAADKRTGTVFVRIGESVYAASRDDGGLRLIADLPGLVDIGVGRASFGGSSSLFALANDRIVELHWTGAAPVARADTIAVAEDAGPIDLAVLANDSDPAGWPLTVVGFTQPPPGQGTVAFSADRHVLRWTPSAPDFNGTVTFTYTVANLGATSTGTVTITVTPVNDPPRPRSDNYQIPRNTTLAVSAPGVLANDIDADGPAPLTAALVSPPPNGTFTFNADGSFTYRPPVDYTGQVSFTYQASDSLATSWAATVSITVTAPLTITTTSVEAVIFEGNNQPLSATGGWRPYHFTLDATSAPLPQGMSISTYNELFGMPKSTGIFDVILRATDSSTPVPQVDTQPLTVRASARDQQAYSEVSPEQLEFGAASGRTLAQVVTTGAAGSFSAVRLTNTTCDAGTTVTVELQGVTGGFPPAPDGIAIASGAGGPGYRPIQLSPPVPLPVQSPVALVVGATGGNCRVTNMPSQNWYSGGAAFLRESEASPWQTLQSAFGKADLTFATFVLPLDLVYPQNWLGRHQATKLQDGRVLLTGNAGVPGDVYDPATNTFTPTANSMTDLRFNHTATLLPSGKVLIAGGQKWNGTYNVPLNSAELYDPATNQFTPIGNLSDARAGHTATRLNDGKVLIYGGYRSNADNSVEGVSTVEIFDGTTFSTIATRPGGRWEHTATLLQNGKVLIVGGYWSGSAETVELFDPAGGFTTDVAQLREFRAAHTSTLLLDGRVLIAGGSGNYPDLAASYLVYDPAANTVTEGAPMLYPRMGATATLLGDGSVLVAGGNPDRMRAEASVSIERYVPDMGGGSAIPAGILQVTRATHTATLLNNGKVLIAGGSNRSAVAALSAELFDPSAAQFLITTTVLPDASVGTDYATAPLGTTGASGAVTFGIAAGAPPDGITMTSTATGVFEGRPSSAGPRSFVVRAADEAGHTAFQPFTINVNRLVITTAALPMGVRGVPYSAQLEASGWGTKTWTMAGTLPAGLTFNPDGSIAGTPTVTGYYWVTVTAVDSIGQTAQKHFTIQVNEPLVVGGAVTPADGAVLWSYSWWLQSSGGIWPYHWQKTSGQLPPGVSLDPSGSMYGSVVQSTGNYTFDVEVTDSSTPTQSAVGTITIRVGSPDQNFGPVGPTGAGWINIGSGQKVAQVVRTGLAGDLLNVQAAVECSSGDLTVRLLHVDGAGWPDPSRTIASSTTPGTMLAPFTGTPYMRQLQFMVPPALPLDARVAVLFETNGSCRIAKIQAGYDYPDGDAFLGDGSTFTLLRVGDSTRPDVPLITVVQPSGNFTWTLAGRSAHTATTLASGDILLAGGSGTSTTAVTYNPTSSRYTATNGPMNAPRGRHTATVLQSGLVLLVGGTTGSGSWPETAVETAELYDSVYRTFTPVGSLSTPRMNHTATLLSGGQVLITGGQSSSNGPALNTTEIFDPVSESFTAGPPMLGSRSQHTATLLASDRVLIAGGWGGFPVNAERYVPGTGFVSTTGDLASRREMHTATAVSCPPGTIAPTGCVLIAGGLDGATNAPALQAEVYDPGADSFLKVGSLAAPHFRHTATSLADGSVVIAGGNAGLSGPPSASAIVERYDPATGNFSMLRPLTMARVEHTASLLNDGRILMMGGWGRSQNTWSSGELYDVSAPPLAITTTALPQGVVGRAYSAPLTAIGSSPPVVYAVIFGALPPGLALIDGVITGTPTADGDYQFVVEARDSASPQHVATRSFQITIHPALEITTPSPLPNAYTGQQYNVQIAAIGGMGARTWSVSSGMLPSGYVLTGDGFISGVTTATGAFTFSLTVQDGTGATDTAAFSMNVAAPTFPSSAAWTTTFPYGGGIRGRGLVLDPVDHTTLYALPRWRGLFRSSDAAASWGNLLDHYTGWNPFDPTNLQSLSIAPDGRFWAVAGCGVYSSTDRGSTWEYVWLSAGPCPRFIVAASATDLFVGLWGNGAQRSTNGGVSWTAVAGLGSAEVLAIVKHPSSGWLFAGTAQGLFVSTDGGATWTAAAGISRAAGIAIHPTSSAIMYIAGADTGVPPVNRIFKSTDAGITWTALAPSPSWPFDGGSLISVNSNGVVFAVSSNRVFRMTGTDWSETPLLLGGSAIDGQTTSVVTDPADPQVVYVGTDPDGVFKTTDGGSTWTFMSTGMNARGVPHAAAHSVAVDASDPTIVYAGSFGDGERSTDGGQTWSRWTLPNGSARAIVTQASAPGVVYALGASVWKNTEYGTGTWTPTSDPCCQGDGDLVAGTTAGTLYLSKVYGGASDGVYKTVNGGNAWTPAGLAGVRIHTLAVAPGTNDVVYAGTSANSGTNSAIYKTTNGGSSWVKLAGGLPSEFNPNQIIVHPANPNIVIMGSEVTNSGVYRSADGGATWTQILQQNVNAIAVDPSNVNLIYVGTWNSGGLFRLVYNGTTWTATADNAGLPSWPAIDAIAQDPSDPAKLMLGTTAGVYTRRF